FPKLPHGPPVVRRQLSDVAVRPRHLKEAPLRAVAAPTSRNFFDCLPIHFQTALAQRNDQPVTRRIVSPRRPVPAALRRWTRGPPLSHALLDDIVAIVRLPGAGVDGIVYV